MNLSPSYKNLLIACLMFFICSQNGIAQKSPGSSMLQALFVKDSIVTGSTFYFNSLSLTNTSNKILALDISLITPCFISLVSLDKQQVTLKPQENFILPIRFTGNANTKCNQDWQSINAIIKDEGAGIAVNSSFLVKPAPSAKWKALLLQPVIYLQPEQKALSFFLRLQNSGNVKNDFKLQFQTSLPLSIKKETHISLSPGEASMQEIKLLLTPAEFNNLKDEEINIFISANDEEKRMLIQKIGHVGNIYRENTNRWQKLPLAVELNALNVAGASPYFFTRIEGSLWRNERNELNVYYQSDYYYDRFYANTGIQQIEYNNQKWNISGGTITDFNHFVINGNGLRARYAPDKNSWYEAAYIKGRIYNTDQFYGKLKKMITNKLTYYSNNLYNDDKTLSQKSYLSQHTLEYNFKNNFTVGVEGGGGIEKINNQKIKAELPSSFAGFYIEKSGSKFNINSRYQFYSKNFPGLNKGFTQYVHDIRYQFGKFGIGSYVEYNKHTPTVLQDSVLFNSFNYSNTDISARLNFTSQKLSIHFLPGIYKQKQNSDFDFHTYMPKLNTQLFFSFGKWQASLINTVGKIKIPEKEEVEDIFSMYNILSVQKGSSGLFARMDYGPYYYFDVVKYLQSDSNKIFRLQVSPYHNINLQKLNLSLRNQLTYSYNRQFNETAFFITNSIYWQSNKHGLMAGINTNFELRSNSNNMFNFVIRKQLNVPVFPKKGYRNFKLILFKDENKNNIQDADDKPIVNARVLINGLIMQTNMAGEVILQNISSKQVIVDLSVTNNVKGWIPAFGYKQTLLAEGKRDLKIAYKPGKNISGRLIIDRDNKSELLMNPENIRVTAISKDGNTFGTLTNLNGEFSLDLPADEYIVSINQNAIDEAFKAIDPVRNADLLNNEEIKIDFIIRQKRREINIIKQ